jgi:hypothetical protein
MPSAYRVDVGFKTLVIFNATVDVVEVPTEGVVISAKVYTGLEVTYVEVGEDDVAEATLNQYCVFTFKPVKV